MFKTLTSLDDCKLAGPDGVIGRVTDFYFNDLTWKIRYVVVDTGTWLSGRRVLLPPVAFDGNGFGKLDEKTRMLRVNLARRQIQSGPLVGVHDPITPDFEAECDRHYGWTTEWASDGARHSVTLALETPPPANRSSALDAPPEPVSLHLRSTQVVTGYEIRAMDGAIGSVVDFTVHERTWKIRELVVQTGHWYNRKTVFVLTENVLRIGGEDSSVWVNLTRQDIQQTTRNDVAQAGAGHF